MSPSFLSTRGPWFLQIPFKQRCLYTEQRKQEVLFFSKLKSILLLNFPPMCGSGENGSRSRAADTTTLHACGPSFSPTRLHSRFSGRSLSAPSPPGRPQLSVTFCRRRAAGTEHGPWLEGLTGSDHKKKAGGSLGGNEAAPYLVHGDGCPNSAGLRTHTPVHEKLHFLK